MRGGIALGIVGVLVSMTVGGCGGGKGSSYTSPTSPTVTTPTTTTAPPPPTTTTNVAVTIVGMNGANSYSPNPVTVKVGQTVTWRNADSLPHTATADAGGFDTGTLGAGATSQAITMSTAGSFPYHCTIHGTTMTGTVVVTP